MRRINCGIRFHLAFAFLTLLLIALSAGCGGGSGHDNPPPVTPPAVVSVAPASSAVDVPANVVLTAAFSKAMNSATISTTTFTVRTSGGAAVTGTVSYSNQAATFTPAANFSSSTSYTATITTGATDTTGVSLAFDFSWNFTTAAAGANTALVDYGNVKQTIRGFGGSTAWMNTMPDSEADALFGTLSNNNMQLGLSILRIRIDPASTTGGMNWAQELGSAQKAHARGALVIAAPWTPPGDWKTSSAAQPYSPTCSNTPASLCGGYLDSSHYADYANYLESFVTYMHNGGVDLYSISLQNEPDTDINEVHYESCNWTPAQIDTWVVNHGSTITTRLMVPESLNFSTTFSDPTLNDVNAADKVDIIGGHIYGSSPAYYANAVDKGKEVWMTEHFIMPPGDQQTISDALTAAMEIHNSLVTAQYNAYLWWWLANRNSTMKYGLVDTSYSPTYYGHTLAHYAKFIRPGYVRVDASANPTANVYVSAYKGDGHYVIVAINTGSSAINQSFTIQNQTLTTLTPYQTSISSRMTPQSGVTVLGGSVNYILPAQSITTFVQ